MEEGKDKDASLTRGNLEESTVIDSEQVASESETHVQSILSEVPRGVGMVEKSTGEGGSGGGEVTMMEVGGVYGNDSALTVGGEESSRSQYICDRSGSGEASVERDLTSSIGGDDVAGDLCVKGIEVSIGEASSSDRVEREVGGPVVEESVEKNKKVIGGEAEGDVADELPLRKVEIVNHEVQNLGIGTEVEESKEITTSPGGETVVVHLVQSVVGSEEEDPEGGLHVDIAERGSEMVCCAGNEAQAKGPENGVESSTMVSCTLDSKMQVVEEVAMDNKHSLGKDLDKNARQGSESNGAGEDAHQVVEMQKLGDLDDDIWNPGIETTDAGCPAIVEESSAPAQVVEEDALVASEEALDSQKNNPSSQAVEGISSSAEEEQIPVVETDDGGTRKDAIFNASPDSLDEQIPVAVRGEVSVTDQGEYMCTTMEGMDTDAFDENLSFSLEELQGHVETADGSAQNQCNIYADSTSSFQPTQVVGGEHVAVAKKVHPDFEEAQQLKLAENLHQGIALVGSNIDQANEIEKQVDNAKLDSMLSCSGNVQNNEDEILCTGTELDTQVSGRERIISSMHNKEALNDAEPDSLDRRKEILIRKHLTKVVTDGGSTESHRNACSDSISTEQTAFEVVTGEGMTVDDVPKYANVEVLHQYSSDLDATVSCSGNEQSFPAEVVCGSTDMDTQVMDGGEIAPKDSKQVLDSNVGGLESADLYEVDSTVGQEMQVEEQGINAEQVDLHGAEGMEVEEPDSEHGSDIHGEEENFVKRTTVKAGNLVKSHQASYQLALEDKGEFGVFDLVWGKVRSHPWWPGQIFDPSDASEKALRYHKKDCFLVAYFGDRTFAWVDASQLKPFYSHFSQVEKQSNAEVFQNAVNCALEEVSRRLELELACSCIAKDAYDDIRLQIVENTGIRQESSMRDGLDEFASVHSFQPERLVEYMRALAQSPSSGADRLELVVAKAQLLSFYRLKGYYQLPEFQFCAGLVEKGVDVFRFEDKVHATPFSKYDEHIQSGQEVSGTQRRSYRKRKHNLKDTMHPRKERSLSELMTGFLDSLDDDEFGTSKLVSPSSGKRRKVVDSMGADSLQDVRKIISLAKVSTTTSQIPKPSFKIGECIRRVASQMTSSPSILKSNSERLHKYDGDGADISFENFEDAEGKMILPADYSSLDDLLSQLHLAARDPMKGYSFLNTIASFFSDFRNSIILSRPVDKAGGKRKRSSHSIIGSPETFEFEDMSDTYWTDRVIQNGAEEQPSGGNGREYQIVPVEQGKTAQKSRRSYSRKQYSDGNQDLAPPKPPGYIDENSPAELILNFPGVDCIPSETNLNKIFKRFGPLKESETEIDEETSRARVVFRKCSDAEVASSSAAKFNIFGSIVVNYQISYIISVPFRTSPIVTTLGEEYAT
ncbi:uncharacterized protein LOC123193071 [Mangifera indica]|uniref:uncharacterized protein LOC123193071 n=1 Tax=Mangifera indica TaxID=29780 RepID=UPI001CF9806C|nr:uncharacterized protein LOC123193071 [Mangifera indica]